VGAPHLQLLDDMAKYDGKDCYSMLTAPGVNVSVTYHCAER